MYVDTNITSACTASSVLLAKFQCMHVCVCMYKYTYIHAYNTQLAQPRPSC